MCVSDCVGKNIRTGIDYRAKYERCLVREEEEERKVSKAKHAHYKTKEKGFIHRHFREMFQERHHLPRCQVIPGKPSTGEAPGHSPAQCRKKGKDGKWGHDKDCCAMVANAGCSEGYRKVFTNECCWKGPASNDLYRELCNDSDAYKQLRANAELKARCVAEMPDALPLSDTREVFAYKYFCIKR